MYKLLKTYNKMLEIENGKIQKEKNTKNKLDGIFENYKNTLAKKS